MSGEVKIAIFEEDESLSWEETTIGLVYSIRAWAKLLRDIDPLQPPTDKTLEYACRAMIPAILETTQRIIDREIMESSIEGALNDRYKQLLVAHRKSAVESVK